MQFKDKNSICVVERKVTARSGLLGVFWLGILILSLLFLLTPLYDIIADRRNLTAIGLVLFVHLAFAQILICTYESRIYFDIGRRMMKRTDEIWFFKLGKWKQIKDIEYVSVFRQLHSAGEDKEETFHLYDVNLWYTNNKHTTITQYNEREAAYEVALRIANGLNIDMLDATVPNDYKWVEMYKDKVNG